MLAARNHLAGWIPVKKINKIATVKETPTGQVAEIALSQPPSGFDSSPMVCGSIALATSVKRS